MAAVASHGSAADTHHVGLGSLLDAMAEELADMGVCLAELQSIFGDALLSGGGELSTDAIRGIQDLDRLTQYASALSRALTLVAESTPYEASVNIAALEERVALDSLTDRICKTS